MDLTKFQFYQRLVSIGLVQIHRKDGTIWWVGRSAAEEQERLGEGTVKVITMAQAKELDEAE